MTAADSCPPGLLARRCQSSSLGEPHHVHHPHLDLPPGFRGIFESSRDPTWAALMWSEWFLRGVIGPRRASNRI
jgi:hypothetical protein